MKIKNIQLKSTNINIRIMMVIEKKKLKNIEERFKDDPNGINL